MRDFLEDAFQHRDDGYGRAQKHVQRQLPKRFYETVEVAEVDGGFAVTLDKRVAKSPQGQPLVVGHPDLAGYMREEWDAQQGHVDPDLMPHVKLVNSALAGGEAARPALVGEVVKYAGNDLLLYRADSPRELVARQEEVWDAVLVKLARHFSVMFQPTVGILHKEQSAETLARLRASLDDLGLVPAAALVSITGLTGSGLLAIALRENLIDRDAAWVAAHVDEDYQISLWGEDFEAAERRQRRRSEFDAAANVISLLA